MESTAPLEALPMPRGAAVLELLPRLERALAGGAPVLPVPAADPHRAALLRRTQRAGAPAPADVAVVACTSGSTGAPKGALLGRGNLAASAEATHARLGGPGRWLLATPADHVAGLQVLLRSIRAGYAPAVLDLAGGFDPARLAAAIRAMAGPRRYLSLVPLQLAAALAEPAAAAALAELDAVLVGGQATDPAVLDRARAAGIPAVTTYGSSETCGGVVYDGRPLAGVRVTVEGGRLILAGPMVARGYRNLDSPDLRGGVFRTADAGEIAADGAVRVLGRVDDMILSGGLKHHPRAIEGAIAAVRGVAAVAVAGVPDARLGEAVAALVVPADPARAAGGRVDPALAASIAAAAARLGRHARPRVLAAAAALPTLPSGKVDRRAVARLLAAAADGG
ncbi:o-succinylbenzoate--CoA ligase [Corynebacterium sphenisci]|uniref:o-succinylbenzoate--CoA ligase n=1 Tax=Corynebacterium sphenisci TaxID=191493 RepID=UPI0026E10EDA|nr:o-succinylbenzoate--CoA ligase [Corynebacterium sphenisci]MDO5730847.1 o-succinylbenzoate--CoA ligase [Corynebacterium sphenisci]